MATAVMIIPGGCWGGSSRQAPSAHWPFSSCHHICGLFSASLAPSIGDGKVAVDGSLNV